MMKRNILIGSQSKFATQTRTAKWNHSGNDFLLSRDLFPCVGPKMSADQPNNWHEKEKYAIGLVFKETVEIRTRLWESETKKNA